MAADEFGEEKYLLKEKKGGSKKINRYLLIGGIFFFLVALGITLLFSNERMFYDEPLTCGDGTFYSTCSLTKPYYCSEGILMLDAIRCGCPEILEKEDQSCFSDLYTGEHEISLKYILRGEERILSYKMYVGVNEYLETLPRFLFYSEGELPRRDDFKLMKIGDPLQREALMPLVVAIQNSAPDSVEDQARIAISLVQNIDYGEPEFQPVFGGRYEVRMSRYPYQTLEEYTGSCEGKSELLAFLLKELGYGISMFYYAEENHEAVGIKCPLEYSLKGTGYCFVETTVPSPISYSTGVYLGIVGGRLNSEPQTVIISKGFSLSDDMYEYEDAKSLDALMSGKGVWINGDKDFRKISEKYGLIN